MNKHSADATTAEEALAIQETLDSGMATEVAMKNTLLTPRFYTTDFDELDAIDVSHIRSEWDPLIERMLSDPNKGHFKKNDDWDQVYWDLDAPIRANVISKYTKEYETVGVRVGLVGKSLQETGETDPLETDFVISVNLICEDYDTSEPRDWKSLGINEEMFEEVADAMQMQFEEWAENGAEDRKLKFPAKIKSAFIDCDDETCSHYGTFVSWNDEKVY